MRKLFLGQRGENGVEGSQVILVEPVAKISTCKGGDSLDGNGVYPVICQDQKVLVAVESKLTPAPPANIPLPSSSLPLAD